MSRRPFEFFKEKVLVESGTYMGDGVRHALECGFEKVLSYEVTEQNYKYCLNQFAGDSRVQLFHKSSVKMKEDIQDIKDRIVFWLDGHYSGGTTSFEDVKCPILNELDAIAAHPRKDHVILIDDVRLFGTHEFDHIPLQALIDKILAINPRYQIRYMDGYVQDDILVATVESADTEMIDFRTHPLDFLDAIVYINLDSRLDRRDKIIAQLQRIPNLNWDKVHRFPAITGGLVGCHKSHMAVVNLAIDRKWKNILILEDDFTFQDDINMCLDRLHQFYHLKGSTFGMVQLAHNLKCSHPIDHGLHQVRSSSDASGYILNERIYSSLLKAYATDLPLLEQTLQHWLYLNDVSWNKVRGNFLCLAFVPSLGFQCEGYSDLSNTFKTHQKNN